MVTNIMTVHAGIQTLFATILLLHSIKGDSSPPLWPKGRYGLPRPRSDCPMNSGFAWTTGSRFQALYPASYSSAKIHLYGSVTSEGVTQSFCIKNTTDGDQVRPEWPPGKYCIFAKGNTCPKSMRGGWYLFDDRLDLTPSPNRTMGTLPDGVYNENTLYDFCCSTGGSTSDAISLPLDSPFYLFPYQSAMCQKVKGALINTEYIWFHTDMKNVYQPPLPFKLTADSSKLFYCHYRACGYNINSTIGEVKSEYFPAKYPVDVDCKWRITVPSHHSNYHFVITLMNFTLDASNPSCSASCECNDWLRITGTGNDSRTYCAGPRKPPSVIIFTGSSLTIDFHSDKTGTASGFRLLYVALPIEPTSMTTVTSSSNGSSTASLKTTEHSKPTDPELPTTTAPHKSTGTLIPSVGGRVRHSNDFSDWVIVVAVLVAIATMVTVGLLAALYIRRSRKDPVLVGRLTIRYSTNEDSDIMMERASKIDMYTGDLVDSEPIPETDENPFYESKLQIHSSRKDSRKGSKKASKQESKNPLYDGAVNAACELDSKASVVPSQKSENPIYGDGEDNQNKKSDVTPKAPDASDATDAAKIDIYSSVDADHVALYESLPDLAKETENPLYERLM
ncbi:uncharacterized protein LOC5506407 isoform X1 [Nematostella vectensis]|uniref:uncharacterized protein LOC5506407 isoform X1 n=2 Tax=Nematostella vectensis TaxID=45351 RepID=UPI00138FE5C6|nr:uncharacterized protein LOC5506407 isoform X1 [Nematostella vectensis]